MAKNKYSPGVVRANVIHTMDGLKESGLLIINKYSLVYLI